MLRYGISRLTIALLTVLVTAIAAFVMVRLAPGDPVAILIGEHVSAEELARARQEYGLDGPIAYQLLTYIWKAIRLDFGNSIVQGVPVAQLVLARIPATLVLAVVTMALIVAIAIPLGIASAVYEGRKLDRATSGAAFVALSLPDFWVGIVLILVFARWLQFLPSNGAGSISAIIMPAITLALPLVAINLRLMRNETANVLKAPYVVLVKSRGIAPLTILRRHVLRNAVIPVLTVAGVQFGKLLGGAAIVETVFAWPGLGELLVRSISSRDYPVVQGCIVVITVMVVGANFLVDLIYRHVDPRFRT